jgi:hypothetical protein
MGWGRGKREAHVRGTRTNDYSRVDAGKLSHSTAAVKRVFLGNLSGLARLETRVFPLRHAVRARIRRRAMVARRGTREEKPVVLVLFSLGDATRYCSPRRAERRLSPGL